jgi:hypothetical protein
MDHKNQSPDIHRTIVFDMIYTADSFPVYWIYFKDQYGLGIDPDDLLCCEYNTREEMKRYILDGYKYENLIEEFQEDIDEWIEEIEEEERAEIVETMVDDFNIVVSKFANDLPFLKKLDTSHFVPRDGWECPRLLVEYIIEHDGNFDVENWFNTNIERVGKIKLNNLIENLYK